MEPHSGALKQYAQRITTLYLDYLESWPSVLIPRRSPGRPAQRGAEQRREGEGGDTGTPPRTGH
jgi:hypothetical protein